MIRDFINTLFPDYCVACLKALAKGEEQLCLHCQYALPYTDYHLHPDNELIQKLGNRMRLTYALAYLIFSKQSRVQRILHALKYSGNQEIGCLMGRWYGRTLLEQQYEQKFDLILPVPLHKSKLRQRGYNQSDCFALGLSESLGVPWEANTLVRAKATATQTRRGRWERWQNVEDIFEVAHPNQVEGKRILLVDDVVTTGSTLEACALVLQENHVQNLSIAVLAVAT